MKGADVMTERQLRRGDGMSRVYTSRREPISEPLPVVKRAKQGGQRVVTVPDADPTAAWNTFAQRQQQLRNGRTRPQKYVMVARTFAQTGVRATSGRMKAVRKLPQSQSMPVPARSSAQKKGSRWGWLWRLLSLFALLVVFILGGHYLLTSSAFRIAQVNVVGTHNAKLVDEIQQMGMQGQNIFLLNVTTLTERIGASPFVANVDLSKNWPNQITITVTERVPVLLWQTPQGVYSVDATGVVIAPAAQTPTSAHLITVIDGRKLGKNQMVQPGTRLDQADIAFAQKIFLRLPALTGITNFTLRYDNSSDNNGETISGSYTVVGPGGWLAYLGNASDVNPLENRLLELRAILALAQHQQVSLATIDLRYGLHPVYTVK